MNSRAGTPATPPDPERHALRQRLRAARRALDPAARARRDQRIGQHLLAAPELQRAGQVAAFLAFDGEPELGPVLEQLRAAGVAIALPVVGAPPELDLEFRAWPPGAALERNRMGIFEPAAGPVVELSALDVVLTPLVAWDASGNRLGMGAGLYDRAFAARRESPTPLRVGVAYALQRSDELEPAAWDVPLHAVVTEEGWFTCRA